MKKQYFIFLIVTVLVISILLAGCAPSAPAPSSKVPAASSSAPAKPPASSTQAAITINAVSAWPTNYANLTKALEWIDTANKASQGKFNIKVLGGPEVIPYDQQVGAVQRGVADMTVTAGGYYQGDIPEVYSLVLSQLNPIEERKSGYYDLLNKVHAEHGLYYFGRVQAVTPLAYFCFNVQAKGPADLAGLKFRSSAPYDPLLKEMKIVPVTMGEPDIYNAMQQHVVDGFMKNISTGFVAMGLQDVTKYILSTPIYQSPTVVLMNLDKWNALPADVRKILNDTFIQMESTQMDFWAKQNQGEIDKATAAGVKLIDWSAADSKWLTDEAFKLGWDMTLPKCPKYGAQLKELSTKK